jgi:hypothetical protein
MARYCVAALVALGATSGCTSLSLQRHTLSQIQSLGDYRYQAAVNCLALVAADPNALPSFCILSTGGAKITDAATVTSATTWTRALGSFAMEMLTVTANRAPNEMWTVDPVADYAQLEALRSACQWVLYGPERATRDFPGILDSPVNNPLPGAHFGVAERLRRLPCGWLHVGKLTDVPLSPCYKAHRAGTWVWVDPDGMTGLADFTLALLDIATLDLSATEAPPVLVTLTRIPDTLYAFTSATWDRLSSRLSGPDLETLKAKFPDTGRLYNQAQFDAAMPWKASDPKYSRQYNLAATAAQVNNASAFVSGAPFVSPLQYTEYRVIKVEHWRDISDKIQAASDGQQSIDVPWNEWSAPYHGARTNVKPNVPTKPTVSEVAGQNTPPTRTPLWLAPVNAEGISQGPTIGRGIISPLPPPR